MESQPQNPEFRIRLENFHPCNIRIYQECEDGIEKSVPLVISLPSDDKR